MTAFRQSCLYFEPCTLFITVCAFLFVPISASAQNCIPPAYASTDCAGTIKCPAYPRNPECEKQNGNQAGILGKSCTVAVSGQKVTGQCCENLKCRGTSIDGKPIKSQEQIAKDIQESEAKKEAAASGGGRSSEAGSATPTPAQEGSVQNPISGANGEMGTQSSDPSASPLSNMGYTPETLQTLQEMSEQGTNLEEALKSGDFGIEKSGVPLEFDSKTGNFTPETYQRLYDSLGQDAASLQPISAGSQYDPDNTSKPSLWNSGAQTSGWNSQDVGTEVSQEDWWSRVKSDASGVWESVQASVQEFFGSSDVIQQPSPTWEGGSSPYLIASRADLMAELDSNPALRTKIAAIIAKEAETDGSDGGALSSQAVLESMVNRANLRGYSSLNQAINDGFYGPVNRGEVASYINKGKVSSADYARADAAIEAVRGGSNLCNFCTDQGMKNEIHPNGRINIGGEYFGHMAGSSRWANAQSNLESQYNVSSPSQISPQTTFALNTISPTTNWSSPTPTSLTGFSSPSQFGQVAINNFLYGDSSNTVSPTSFAADASPLMVANTDATTYPSSNNLVLFRDSAPSVSPSQQISATTPLETIRSSGPSPITVVSQGPQILSTSNFSDTIRAVEPTSINSVSNVPVVQTSSYSTPISPSSGGIETVQASNSFSNVVRDVTGSFGTAVSDTFSNYYNSAQTALSTPIETLRVVTQEFSDIYTNEVSPYVSTFQDQLSAYAQRVYNSTLSSQLSSLFAPAPSSIQTNSTGPVSATVADTPNVLPDVVIETGQLSSPPVNISSPTIDTVPVTTIDVQEPAIVSAREDVIVPPVAREEPYTPSFDPPPGAGATTLSQWYKEVGRPLPSVSERRDIYNELVAQGLAPSGRYTGTTAQNRILLQQLKKFAEQGMTAID